MRGSIFNPETMKRLPIGYEDFKDIIIENLYYIDKTLLIRDLIERRSRVNLFTRPRRFGKTLNLSMLKYYFEDAYDIRGEHLNHAHLFDGLKISDWDGKYMKQQGQFPVISLTLKSAKQGSFVSAYKQIVNQIAGEFSRHKHVLTNEILIDERERYREIMLRKADHDRELIDDGYQHIAHYGIAFFGKDCEVHAENVGKFTL